MGIMAGYTVTGTHWAMLMLLGEDLLFMTVETEAGSQLSFAAQLKTLWRLMRIVTLDAPLATEPEWLSPPIQAVPD